MPLSTIDQTGLTSPLVLTADITVNGLTVGRGAGAVSTNTAVGVNTLGAVSQSGTYNTAYGWKPAFTNTSGSFLTAIGEEALYGNTTGSYNTAVGSQALATNTIASNNTAVGYQAGYSNTTGGNNVSLGMQAAYYCVSGANNTAIGQASLYYATNGNNTGCGFGTGNNVTTGTGNTFVGAYTGNTTTTGSNNVVMGFNTYASGAATSGETVIGANATGKGSNTGFIYAGGGGVYQSNNSTTWSVTSDQRLKKNIVDNTVGLTAINGIKVRNFEYRLPDEITDLDKSNAVAITGVQLGPIAQELQQVLPDCVKTESTGVMSVDSSDVLWHLVTAVQQLSAQVTALQAKAG